MTYNVVSLALPVFAIGIVAGATATELAYSRDADSHATIVMPYCETEDGSDYPNRYCLWVDHSGRGYVNAYSQATVTRGGTEPDTLANVAGYN